MATGIRPGWIRGGREGSNLEVEYVKFPDEGHGWRKTPNRIKSTVEVTRLFAKHLEADRTAAR